MRKFSELFLQYLKELFFTFSGVMLCTLMYFSTMNSIHQSTINKRQLNLQTKIDALEARSFDSFMSYHKIHPRNAVAHLSSEAWFWSDSEVFEPGFKIEWHEHIECDFNPFDDVDQYVYYRRAVTTSRMQTEVRGRRKIIEGVSPKSFPVTDAASSEILKYPSTPSNCRLVSDMIQYHEYGISKRKTTKSKVVKIRKLNEIR